MRRPAGLPPTSSVSSRPPEGHPHFEVVACGHRRWRELLTKHPSKEKGYRYDAATFIPAALAECVVQFTSVEQAGKACDKLTTGQVSKLFNTVREVNEGDDEVPTVRGS
jgi:hypothetical protein